MQFLQSQIWLVNFDPSFGHEYKKVRPALIVEGSGYIDSSNLVTVLPISSVVDKKGHLDILLPKDDENRLMKDSLIKTLQISSFDKRRFIKFIGICNQEIFKSVQSNIKKYLSL
jgi:mRNA interferase MazF